MDKNLSKKRFVKALKEKEFELAPIDKATAERIKKAVDATNTNATSVIHEAMRLLEKSLGREVTFTRPGSRWDLTVKKFIKYKIVDTYEPEKE